MNAAFFASMPLGLSLFALVALVSILGSVVPAWSQAIYGSWAFQALLGALAVNTGLCTLRQLKWLAKGTPRQKILVVVHSSVLVIALAGLWGTFAFRSSTVTVRAGEAFEVAGQAWTLEGMKVERYPDGTVSDWISFVATPAGRQEIRVNHPAETGAVKVLQSGYSRFYSVKVSMEGQEREFELAQDTEVPLTTDGSVGMALSPPQAGILAAAQDDSATRRTVDLLLTSHGKILQSTALFEGVPLQLGDSGIVITVTSSVDQSILLLREAPGLWLVWLGLGLLAVSVTLLMLAPSRKGVAP